MLGGQPASKLKMFLQSNCNFWHVTWNLFKVVSIKQKSLWGFSASGKLIMYNIFREINYPRDMVDTIHKPIPGNFSRNKQSLWLQPPRRERTFSWSRNKKSSWTKLLCLKALHFTHWVYFWGCSPYELGDSSKYYRDISQIIIIRYYRDMSHVCKLLSSDVIEIYPCANYSSQWKGRQ